jgi:hypothetical protein
MALRLIAKDMAQMAITGTAEHFIAAKGKTEVFFDPDLSLRDGFMEGGPTITGVVFVGGMKKSVLTSSAGIGAFFGMVEVGPRIGRLCGLAAHDTKAVSSEEDEPLFLRMGDFGSIP